MIKFTFKLLSLELGVEGDSEGVQIIVIIFLLLVAIVVLAGACY